MPQSCRTAILVKALPQPSSRYGETVCCAGVTETGEWKRLYPVRFRHLTGDSAFKRWDFVRFDYGRPKSDPRAESCHVHEESIRVDGSLDRRERVRLLSPLILGSAEAAMAKGQSLALIRPRNTRFRSKPKPTGVIEAERAAFDRAARQMGMFDEQLAAIEPSPYHFSFSFDDDAGSHTYTCGDWEAHTMFWREAKRTSASAALKWMDEKFNEEYPKAGMAFAIGNQAKRPRTWQLLGVLRLDVQRQPDLFG